jgi:hypothetical protein
MEDEYQELGGGDGGSRRDVTAATAGRLGGRGALEEEREEEEEEEMEADEGEGPAGATNGGDIEPVQDVGVSDLDYLRSKISKWSDSDSEEEGPAGSRGDQGGVGPSSKGKAKTKGKKGRREEGDLEGRQSGGCKE